MSRGNRGVEQFQKHHFFLPRIPPCLPADRQLTLIKTIGVIYFIIIKSKPINIPEMLKSKSFITKILLA
jgi:hypothetical protein